MLGIWQDTLILKTVWDLEVDHMLEVKQCENYKLKDNKDFAKYVFEALKVWARYSTGANGNGFV